MFVREKRSHSCPRSAEHERLEADTFISLMLRSKVFEVTRHGRVFGTWGLLLLLLLLLLHSLGSLIGRVTLPKQLWLRTLHSKRDMQSVVFHEILEVYTLVFL